MLQDLQPKGGQMAKRFLEWRNEHVPKEEHKEEELDIQIFAWTKTLEVKQNTKRVYFLTVLSTLSWEHNRRFQDTPRLRKLKTLLAQACASLITKKAKILTITELHRQIEKRWWGVAETLLLTCARLGNAGGFRTKAVDRNSRKWTFMWHSHKTLAQVGTREVSIRVPDELEASWTLIVDTIAAPSVISLPLLQQFKIHIKAKKIMSHSFRRSGVHYWACAGMSQVELMKITLHTAPATLLGYLEGEAEEEEEEES